MATAVLQSKRSGIGYWLEDVLRQCDEVAADFSSDSVHDLRTSLRRCRSVADGVMVFDPGPSWKKMKRAGKLLFQSLGALRDTHVMQEWIEKLMPESAPAATAFTGFLHRKEEEHRATAAAALAQFDRKQWSAWAAELPVRAARIPLNSPLYLHLALERWHQARELHHRALRNRTQVSFHDLRIGIKRFRYTIENFLPRLHEFWGSELKQVQDALGDVHDLDVLWQTIVNVELFPDAVSQGELRARVQHEREQRLQQYRESAVGRDSLWQFWRAGLPQESDLRKLGFDRLEIWASFLTPDVAHTKHVANLALQIFDGMKNISEVPREDARFLLRAAALMHDVGHAHANRGHHKASARMIRRLSPPLGWTAEELQLAALVARYHRGALPAETQPAYSAISAGKRRLVQFLAGILRLACACDHEHDTRIRSLWVQASTPVLTMCAEGYEQATPLARHVAAERHLLEIACGRPVYVLPRVS